MKKQKILSLFTAFSLASTMFGTFPAFAEGNTTTITGDGSAEKTGTMTISLKIKATPEAPEAPEKSEVTKNSITLKTVDGCEYSMDFETWQESPIFTGLTPGTEYTFWQRKKADDDNNASPASEEAKISTLEDTYELTITLVITNEGAVINRINSLPDADEVTTADKEDIEAARAAYDALSDEDKEKIDDDTLKKLTDAEDALAAAEVIEIINELPDFANVEEADAEDIAAAREAYEKLTPEQQARVDDEILKKLTDAEDKLVIIKVMSEVKPIKDLVYDGIEHELVIMPTTALPDGYVLKFAVSDTISVEIADEQFSEEIADELFSEDVPTGKNAGEYLVWFKAFGDEEHSDSDEYTATSYIAKAPSTNVGFIADITNQKIENGKIDVSKYLGEGAKYKSSEVEGISIKVTGVEDGMLLYNAESEMDDGAQGTIVVTFESPNYADYTLTIDVTAKGVITSKELVIKGLTDQIYTGEAIKPSFEVYSGGKLLVEKTDYTVKYANNTNAGIAKITVTGKGNYKGTATDTFVIKQADLSSDDFEAADITLADTGKAQKVKPEVYWNGAKFTKFKYQYCEAGTETVTTDFTKSYDILITPKDKNFTGKRIIHVIIGTTEAALLKDAKISIAKDSSVLLGDYTTETGVTPKFSVTIKKTTYIEDKDYTVTYSNNKAAGKATATIVGNGTTLIGKVVVSFNVKASPIRNAVLTGIADKPEIPFDPSAEDGMTLSGYKLTNGNEVLIEDKDYTVSYKNNTKAGSAKLIITGIGRFTGTKNITFKITTVVINEENVKISETALYSAGGAKPRVAVVVNGINLTEGKDYTVKCTHNKTVGGTGTIDIKGKGNFKGIVTKTFTIEENKVPTVEVKANDIKFSSSSKSKNVNSVLKAPTVTDTVTGKNLAKKKDYLADLTYEISADGVNFKPITEENKKEKLVDFMAKAGVTNYAANGFYIRVTVTLTGSYSGECSGIYHVTESSVSSAKVIIADQTYTGDEITFDEKSAAEMITVTIGGETLVYGKDFVIVEGSYEKNTMKGTAYVVIKGIGKYSGTKKVSFKILAKDL